MCFAKSEDVTILLCCEKSTFLEVLKDFPILETQIKHNSISRKEKFETRMKFLDKLDKPNSPDGQDHQILKSNEYLQKVILGEYGKRRKSFKAPTSYGLKFSKTNIEPNSAKKKEVKEEPKKKALQGNKLLAGLFGKGPATSKVGPGPAQEEQKPETFASLLKKAKEKNLLKRKGSTESNSQAQNSKREEPSNSKREDSPNSKSEDQPKAGDSSKPQKVVEEVNYQ
jgi:hypothetical protein